MSGDRGSLRHCQTCLWTCVILFCQFAIHFWRCVTFASYSGLMWAKSLLEHASKIMDWWDTESNAFTMSMKVTLTLLRANVSLITNKRSMCTWPLVYCHNCTPVSWLRRSVVVAVRQSHLAHLHGCKNWPLQMSGTILSRHLLKTDCYSREQHSKNKPCWQTELSRPACCRLVAQWWCV